MDYVEFAFEPVEEEVSEMLIALLAEEPFDTFEQKDKSLLAYIRQDALYDGLTQIVEEICRPFHCTPKITPIADKNWNETWEKEFNPVLVDTRCAIRAPFHTLPTAVDYDILIEPRMSFGTGHHPSTLLMVRAMLLLPFEQKTVCDAGCGTAVLAILAAKLKASSVYAVDNNDWAFHNAIDNLALNNTSHLIEVALGELDVLDERTFDIILANINRSVILNNLNRFRKCLNPQGTLLVSGILTADLPMVIPATENAGFQVVQQWQEEDWSCLWLQPVRG